MRGPRSPRRWLAGLALAGAAGCGGGGGERFLDPRLTRGTVDFEVDAAALAASWRLEDVDFAADDCAFVEGSIAQPGLRRLLRFDTVIANYGEFPATIGDPSDPEPPFTAADFEWSPCHQHFHFTGYADYELRDVSGAAVGTGHKQAFCLLDTVQVVDGRGTRRFDCEFQGISSGWADEYDSSLDGQWIDVTGLPEGDYALVVSVNPNGAFVESPDLRPDVAMVTVHVPDPAAPVP